MIRINCRFVSLHYSDFVYGCLFTVVIPSQSEVSIHPACYMLLMFIMEDGLKLF